MNTKRVVITGLGCVSSAGIGINVFWDKILNEESLISKILCFDTNDYAVKVAGEINLSEKEKKVCESIVSFKEKRRMDDFIYHGVIAGYEALKDANLLDWINSENAHLIGAICGSGVGGMKSSMIAIETLNTRGPNRVSPFFLPGMLINLLPGQISIKFGLKGPSLAHVSACATSAHSIGEAFRMIKDGMLDIAVAGGSESAISPIGIAAFMAMNALATGYEENPEKASRPLDKNRNGFVMSDCSAMLILEEYEHAKKRGAKIYGEIVGYGLSCDANHITEPDLNGNGVKAAVNMAIKMAKIEKEQIDYVNLHGTSTPVGDPIEANTMREYFGHEYAKKLAMSSTKSMTGHALGAAGALEAIICIKALQEGIIPASINLDDPIEICNHLNIITKTTKTNLNYALSNSFGFGGMNAALIFKKFDE